MNIEGRWISYCHDSGIERDNPQTGKTEMCEGYFCQVYEDENYECEVDSFCLAVGYELSDMSGESLEKGIREYLRPSWKLEQVTEGSSGSGKKGVLEQLSDHRGQVREQGAMKPKTKQTGHSEPEL